MKKRAIPSLILGAGLLLAGCGKHAELLETWEKYEPTPLYRDALRPAPAPQPAPSAPDREFEEEALKVRELKEKWEKSLAGPEREEAFYRPDPARLKVLEGGGRESSSALEALAAGFTLEDVEILTLLRNPGIKAAERNVRAALDSYDQAGSLDEILRQYAAFTKGLMVGIGPMGGGESPEAKFPFPGVLALKGQVVTQEVLAVREEMAIAARSALTQSRQAYWNLLFTHRARKITGDMLSLLKHLEGVASRRYETGKTSFQDLIRIRIEADKLEEELKTLGEEQRNLEAKILEILNLPPSAPIGLPVSTPPAASAPPLEGLFALARENRQELRQTRAMIGKMERMIEMAETMIYPPYSLGLSAYRDEAVNQVGSNRMEEPFGLKPPASTGAGLPRMPWYGTNDAYLRQTRQKLSALREELKKAEEETHFRVREAWFRLDRARREEILYAQKVVGLSQAALEVSRRGYETGQVGFPDVIDSFTTWLQSHLALERRRSDLGVYGAELEEAVGVPLGEGRASPPAAEQGPAKGRGPGAGNERERKGVR